MSARGDRSETRGEDLRWPGFGENLSPGLTESGGWGRGELNPYYAPLLYGRGVVTAGVREISDKRVDSLAMRHHAAARYSTNRSSELLQPPRCASRAVTVSKTECRVSRV